MYVSYSVAFYLCWMNVIIAAVYKLHQLLSHLDLWKVLLSYLNLWKSTFFDFLIHYWRNEIFNVFMGINFIRHVICTHVSYDHALFRPNS